MNSTYVSRVLYKHLGVIYGGIYKNLDEVCFKSSDSFIYVSIKKTKSSSYKLHICDIGFYHFEYLTFNSFIKAVEYLKANYKTHFYISKFKYKGKYALGNLIKELKND